jgi:hypothetical protein
MNLEGFLLSEMTQAQKTQITYPFHLCTECKIFEFTEEGSRKVEWGGAIGEMLVKVIKCYLHGGIISKDVLHNMMTIVNSNML